MKNLFVAMLLFFSVSTFAKDISLKVKGMVCSMCAQGIQKKFGGRGEVESVKVDLDTKLVSIKTKEGKDISDDELKKVITEAGYNVESIERK